MMENTDWLREDSNCYSAFYIASTALLSVFAAAAGARLPVGISRAGAEGGGVEQENLLVYIENAACTLLQRVLLLRNSIFRDGQHRHYHRDVLGSALCFSTATAAVLCWRNCGNNQSRTGKEAFAV